MSKMLKVTLVPQGRTYSLDALAASLDNVRKLVWHVDYSVTRRTALRKKPRAWRVHEITSSFPTIVLEPPLERGIETATALVSGVGQIVNPPEDLGAPEFFSERELEDVRIFHKHQSAFKRIEFAINGREAALGTQTVEGQVDRIMQAEISSLGTLDGDLDAINVRRQPYFTIWEALTGHPVRCFFPHEHQNTVRDLLNKRVRVSGLVHYFVSGRPKRVTGFKAVEDLSQFDDEPPPAFGSIPDLLKDKDSVDVIRALRE